VVCPNGTYFIYPGTCQPCGIGKFSSFALTFAKEAPLPPWPSACSACAAGQYQIAEGATKCNAC